jgi:EAL domain-containing protein (putative c-di-GMP-specific phosphodiesterase class I)
VGASAGVAVSTSDRESAEELMRDADAAMYQAKRAGKGRLEVFEPGMHAAVLERLSLESDLRRAVEREEFRVHYQPILDLASEKVRSLEALVRWEHPERGLLLPAEFITIAEETGLIVPMGRLVMREACRQVQSWRSEGSLDPGVTLCVNISARQLQDRNLVDDLASLLAGLGLEPHALVLEITESMLVQDVPATVARLSTLRALGVRLAIDDFGTGYSSLSYLRRFPFDILKVDRSFISVRTPDAETSSLVGAIVAMSRALGLQTVAEGIEGTEQLDWLKELDCDFGQGYHFARPMTAQDVTAFLGAREPNLALAGGSTAGRDGPAA